MTLPQLSLWDAVSSSSVDKHLTASHIRCAASPSVEARNQQDTLPMHGVGIRRRRAFLPLAPFSVPSSSVVDPSPHTIASCSKVAVAGCKVSRRRRGWSSPQLIRPSGAHVAASRTGSSRESLRARSGSHTSESGVR